MKPIVVTTALLALLVFTGSARAAGEGGQAFTALSNGSALAAEGSAAVLYGALSVVAASGTVMVQSVDTAGDASVVVLAGASDAAGATVRFSSRAARESSLVAGASVNLVAMSTGYLLVASGKVLAFFPNEIGKALNMFAYETRILVPGIIAQTRIAAMLASSTPQRLHEARYNMLAFPYALAYQNSNQWVLETYAAAMSDLPVDDRAQAQAWRPTTSRSSAAWPARSTR